MLTENDTLMYPNFTFLFQGAFGIVKFELIGDDSSTFYFEIDSESGQITLKEKIEDDSAMSYALRVRAYDNGSPRKTDICLLTVNVPRNENGPVFKERSYNEIIFYTYALGSTITTVEATDEDKQVEFCETSLCM